MCFKNKTGSFNRSSMYILVAFEKIVSNFDIKRAFNVSVATLHISVLVTCERALNAFSWISNKNKTKYLIMKVYWT